MTATPTTPSTATTPDAAAARENLATAFEVIRSADQGQEFVGGQFQGAQAVLAQDPVSRQQALAAGERLLASSLLRHNHYAFLDFAIHASLQAGEWEQALRYCDMLESVASVERFPWADFIIARGRALTQHGRGERGPALLAQLRHLLALARERQLNYYAIALGEAVAALERPT